MGTPGLIANWEQMRWGQTNKWEMAQKSLGNKLKQNLTIKYKKKKYKRTKLNRKTQQNLKDKNET